MYSCQYKRDLATAVASFLSRERLAARPAARRSAVIVAGDAPAAESSRASWIAAHVVACASPRCTAATASLTNREEPETAAIATTTSVFRTTGRLSTPLESLLRTERRDRPMGDGPGCGGLHGGTPGAQAASPAFQSPALDDLGRYGHCSPLTPRPRAASSFRPRFRCPSPFPRTFRSFLYTRFGGCSGTTSALRTCRSVEATAVLRRIGEAPSSGRLLSRPRQRCSTSSGTEWKPARPFAFP
jgi:hypothetical protein